MPNQFGSASEFRDIGCQFTFAIVLQAAVEVVEYQLDGRHVRGKSGHDQNARVLGCGRYTVQNASRLIVRNRFFSMRLFSFSISGKLD